MNQFLTEERMIFCEGEVYSADMVNALQTALIEMQNGEDRALQIEIFQCCHRSRPLEAHHKVALVNAVSRCGSTLSGNWLPLVRHVILARTANKEHCQLKNQAF